MSTLKFVKFEKFAKNQQYLNLGPKMPYWAFLTKNTTFMYFWAKNFATILSYLISAAWNLSISKILQQKKKKLNLGPKILVLDILGLEFEKKLSYLKSAPFEFVWLQNFGWKKA